MAKAKFHKSQRVFVKPVGTWAHVEAVVPKWAKGCDEPIKIAYDCGMGREFAQDELEEESIALQVNAANGLGGAWRILRGHTVGKAPSSAGTTLILHLSHYCDDRALLGRMAVPGAEYNLDPYRIERQTEIIVRAPMLMKLLEEFVEHAEQEPEN